MAHLSQKSKKIIEQRSDITIIPLNRNTMITTAPSIDPEKRREDTLCKFIREYIYKVAQVIIASRRVSPNSTRSSLKSSHNLNESWNDLNAPYSQWFRIEMTDSLQITTYIEDECMANWDPRHSDFTLTIDISLSAEPLSEHCLLERWKIKFKKEHIGNKMSSDPSLIYKRMTIQIRSLMSYLRLLPTHSIVQSWEQSMAEQSIICQQQQHNNNNKQEDNINKSNPHNVTPFALYHLIYSHHNKQNDVISNFVGYPKSFGFDFLSTKFGTIKVTCFYGKNIRKDFEWLIRSVPGKNPPIIDDNLDNHIDARSRYWDKKKNDEKKNQKVSDHSSESIKSNKSSSASSASKTQQSNRLKNKLSKHYKHKGPITPSPKFELIEHRVSTSHSGNTPPIKSLAMDNNITHFHESPVLDTSMPNETLDPHKEMEKIRLSTIFGSNPPVISLADVSTINDKRNALSFDKDALNMMSGSQLLDSIVSSKKQIISNRKSAKITIMKTLNDDEQNDDDLNDDEDIFGDVARKLNEDVSDDSNMSDMNCSESDHGDIQDEVFVGYDDNDEKKDEMEKNIAKISECINVFSNVDKVQLQSFKRPDALLFDADVLQMMNGNGNDDQNSDERKKYFYLLSKHFEMRQDRLIQLKKSSTNVLANSALRKK